MPHIAAQCTILSTSAISAHSCARASSIDSSSGQIIGGGRAGAGPETKHASRRTRDRRRNALHEQQIEKSSVYRLSWKHLDTFILGTCMCISDTDLYIYIYIYMSHFVRITVQRRKRSSEISLLRLGSCMCVENAYLCVYICIK